MSPPVPTRPSPSVGNRPSSGPAGLGASARTLGTGTVDFDEEWAAAIEKLMHHLDVNNVPDAVGTAVAVLSQYAGCPLYVEDADGKLRIIEGLWQKQSL